MDCRIDESCNLKRNLWFRLHDVIDTKEQEVLKLVKDAFEREDMQTQYSALGYRIDLYFHKQKLVIEVDELGHANRNLGNEIEGQKVLGKELDCVLILMKAISTLSKKKARYTGTLKNQLKSTG